MRNNKLTIIIVILTVVLAGIAIFTAVRLYQLRQGPVAPNVPSNLPGAATPPVTTSCEAFVFTLLDSAVGVGSTSPGSTGTPTPTPIGSGTGGATTTPSATPIATPTATASPISTSSASSTPTATSASLPDAGVGAPTIFAAGLAVMLILSAVILVI